MNKSAPKLTQIAVMVAFAVSCFGILLFLWLTFGGPTPLRPQGYRANMLIRNGSGLTLQGDVRIAGVTIGKITKVERVGRVMRAEVEIEKRYAPLHRDVKVTLRRKTLLGEAYLELTPGSRSAPTLSEGGTLPLSAERPPVAVDEAFGTFDAPTRRNLQAWLQGWEASVRARGTDLNQAIGRLGPALQDGGDLLSVLRSQRSATQRVIRDTGRTFAVIGRRDARVRELVDAGNRVLATTAARERDLAATVRAFPGFMRALRATLVQTQQLAGPLEPVLRDLRPGARRLRPTLTRAAAVMPDLEAIARDLDRVLDVSGPGLRGLRAILAATGPLFDQLYPFGRQLAPIAAYANFARADLANSWGKVAAATQAKSIDPATGKAVHYLRAIALFQHDDALAGATVRQPYIRGNAYMKPGGVREYDNGGVIKTFDCSNTKNALSGLPFGTAPPCIEQGKVDFGGIQSYYPQLREAP